MTEDKRIIMPGDPGFNSPVEPEVPPAGLPSDLLEAAFQEVVPEVKAQLESAPEAVPDASKAIPEAPKASYKYHRPAVRKSFIIPIPKVVSATLLEDLPRSWERKCYAHQRTYTKNGPVTSPGFREGDTITLTEMIFYPGIGARYAFKEGSRGSYTVTPDQVRFSMAELEQGTPDSPPSAAAIGVELPTEVRNAPLDGQDSQV